MMFPSGGWVEISGLLASSKGTVGHSTGNVGVVLVLVLESHLLERSMYAFSAAQLGGPVCWAQNYCKFGKRLFAVLCLSPVLGMCPWIAMAVRFLGHLTS